MNPYLLKVASHMEAVRGLLGWSQEVLAKKIGVSRPTIINIEKDPTKISKPIAVTFFCVILFEIENRIDKLLKVNYDGWKDTTKREQIIEKIKTQGGITAGTVAGALVGAVPVIGLIGGSIIAVTTAMTAAKLFAKPSKAAEENDLSGEKLRELLQFTINQLKTRLIEYFDIKSLDLVVFVKKIEEGEETPI